MPRTIETTLAEHFKGCGLNQIPDTFICKQYGNQEGSFILYRDGSKGWVDPDSNTVLWFITTK